MMNRHTSFASLAAITAAVAAHAIPAQPGPNITSSTISNIALTGVGNATLNVDGDANNDFKLSWNSYTSSFTIANVAPVNYFDTTQSAVSVGTVINGSTTFTTGYTYTSPGTGITDIGMRFSSAGSTYYGWLEFDFTGSTSDTLGTLKSVTYQSNPYANATVTAVPEPASGLAMAGLAGAAAIGLRKKRRAKKA